MCCKEENPGRFLHVFCTFTFRQREMLQTAGKKDAKRTIQDWRQFFATSAQHDADTTLTRRWWWGNNDKVIITTECHGDESFFPHFDHLWSCQWFFIAFRNCSSTTNFVKNGTYFVEHSIQHDYTLHKWMLSRACLAFFFFRSLMEARSDISSFVENLYIYFSYMIGAISLIVNTSTLLIILLKSSALTREIKNLTILQQVLNVQDCQFWKVFQTSCILLNVFLTLLYVPFFYPKAG